MTVQEHPDFKLGVSGPSPSDPQRITLLAASIQAALPNPPASITPSRVKILRSSTWGMMRNDVEGDCTVAAKWHTVQALSTFERRPFVQADAFIHSEYRSLTGGADTGLSLLDVLKPWSKQYEHALAAYAEIPWTDSSLSAAASRKLLKLSIHIAGSAYIAVDLPKALQRSEFDWRNVGTGPDWRAGTWGGHCVPIFAYVSASGVLTFYALTWGQLVPVSEAFLRAYMPEAWMPVSAQDWSSTSTGKTPNGRTIQAVIALANQIHAA